MIDVKGQVAAQHAGRREAAIAALQSLSSPALTVSASPRLRNPASNLVPARRNLDVRARFDSQFTTPLDSSHFALMDAMSVDAAASWMIRRTLRMKCRYEYHNNAFFSGVVDTYANYVIGTGPRLQVLTKDKALNRELEARFADWSAEVGLAARLRESCAATCYNGEGFLLLQTNPNLDSPVKLDLLPVEADQVSSPLFGMFPADYPDQFFDGVVLDPWRRPSIYHVLRQHPGSFGAFVILGYEFDAWPAANVVHDYRVIRPGQVRGIPRLLPALPNFANLRRLKVAVVLAAENAAKWSISVETNAPADAKDEYGNTVANGDEDLESSWEVEQAMANLMPAGYKASMLHPEQPSQGYEMLINNELSEIGRPLSLPMFVVSLDARQANMSSAYVAMQPMGKAVKVERENYNGLLDRQIFRQFLREAILIDGLFSRDLPARVPHTWTWPRINDHADPSKSASAAEIRTRSGVTSRRQEAGDLSLDLDEQDEMSAKDYGVTVEEYRRMLFDRQRAQAAVSGEGRPAKLSPDSGGPVESDRAPEDVEVDE